MSTTSASVQKAHGKQEVHKGRNGQTARVPLCFEGDTEHVLRLDLPELKEMVSLLRRCSNNLNQVAKRANETGRIYTEDLEDLAARLDRIWESAKAIMTALAKID
jgi:hypothetical protein